MQTAADRQSPLVLPTPLASAESGLAQGQAGLRLPSQSALQGALLRILLLACAALLWLLPGL